MEGQLVTLGDLTSAEAIEDALKEFDDLGRERFLSKYGYGQSTKMFVEWDGKLYDSKAIVGAAHGYQFPEMGPLRHSEFSGGEATVRPKLESLGFMVRTIS